MRKERDELLDLLNQPLEVPELDTQKRDEYRERVRKAEEKISELSSEVERLTKYYQSIVIPKQIRYEIFEEGEQGKVLSPNKRSS